MTISTVLASRPARLILAAKTLSYLAIAYFGAVGLLVGFVILQALACVVWYAWRASREKRAPCGHPASRARYLGRFTVCVDCAPPQVDL